MYPCHVDGLADCDVEEARRYYERRRKDLGAEFTRAVAAAVERICAAPLLRPKFERNFRRSKVPGFPYSVVYRFEGEFVKVVSVLHFSRDPAVLKRRLDLE